MTDKWLTIDQIADYLQASKEKIYKLCQRGKMPASKFGGQWRFKKSEIDVWMLQQRKPKDVKRKKIEALDRSNNELMGEMIRRTRKEKRITIVDLANKMGVSQGYISKLELGQIEPTEEQIEVIKQFIEGKL